MEESQNSSFSFFKSVWFLGGLAAVAVIALCFWGIDYLGSPDDPNDIDVENKVIATVQTNSELIDIARQQGWIDASATEMTSVDAAKVDSLGTAFQNSKLKSFDEFAYFLRVQEIRTEAFSHSDNLKSVVVPANVLTIEDGAFANCPALEALGVDTANHHFKSLEDGSGIICSWKGDYKLVAGCRTTKLTDQIKYLAAQAFRGCTALKTVAWPERFKEIGDEAFRDCTGLEEIEIPQGVRFVQPGTFRGCTALRTVTLPKSVERLQKEAFYGCTSLKTLNCMKKYPPYIESAFDDFSFVVNIPKGMKKSYAIGKGWSKVTNIVEQ